MVDIFHDWNNGPECEKLVRNLQCRLKILKNNTSYKAMQLREDISHLLHDGLQLHAFDKAEKLIWYEHEVIIYDILDESCEFMINFSYINKYKDLANDMDQAVSSLIFSSSRLRDLPSLIQIRNFFRKLYGERFVNVALESLPGNLVNEQIKDCFSIISKSVTVEMKLRLINEIARSLFVDHPEAESSYEGVETSEDEAWSLDIDDEDVEERIVDMDSLSESQNCIKQSVHSSCGSNSPFSSFSDSVEYLNVEKEERKLEFEYRFDISDCEFIDIVPRTSSTLFKDQIDGVEEISYSMVVTPSSESSAAFLDESICSNDIEEYEFADSEGSMQDQRVFKFPLSSTVGIEKLEHFGDKYHRDHFEKKHLNRKSRRKLRNRSISVEKGFISDAESAIYYGGN